nr:hypothetical protein [Tanacetum cinerariifolium]
MPSRRDNRVCTRRLNNSQQAEDVTEVGSNQPNSDQGCASTAQKVALIWKKILTFCCLFICIVYPRMPSRRNNRVSTRGRNSSQQAEDVTEVGYNQPNNDQGMPSRRDNRLNTRGRNNSQQDEDVPEVGSNQPNNSQVPGNARKRVRGPTFMPKVWTKTDEDRISVQFNEYGDKNKANRAKKKMMQVTGKKSYAQVLEKQKEQMEELTFQLLEHELDESGPQDIYSKVMGNDKNGIAEMYGLGVRASDVWGVVGLQVYLKSISNSEIVAKGWIRSLDPDKVVGSEEIRPNWCQVDVQVTIT